MGEAGEAPAIDRGAFVGALYAEYGAGLYRYALMILADRGDAEDAIHQVFAALLRDRSARPAAPREYLRSAVRNAAISMLRRRRVVRNTRLLLLRQEAAERERQQEAEDPR